MPEPNNQAEKITLLHDLHCFPCISWIKLLIGKSSVVFIAYDEFQKRSFQNRYMVAGANGLLRLTIPIAGGREQKKKIGDVVIDYSTNWPLIHWRGLVSSYHKSPFFEYYAPNLQKLLFSGETNLMRFNLETLRWIFETLQLPINWTVSEFFTANAATLDQRRTISPSNYLAFNDIPRYPQVFEDRFGFQPNLSILDLLFCMGPRAENLLKINVF